MPENITSNFLSRGTLLRNGIIISGGNTAPGYSGEITFTMFNSSQCNFKIEMGARFIHMLFYEVKGKTCLYRGQWKGGRVVIEGTEQQV